MKKNFFIKILFTVFVFLGISLSSNEVRAAGPFVGDSTDAGSLRFGIGYGLLSSSEDSTERELLNVPIVQYVTRDGKVVDHLFQNEKYGFNGSSPFNIIENADEYRNYPVEPGSGKIILPNGGSKTSERIIVSEGKKLDSDDFTVKVSMEANKSNSQVLHTYAVTNDSNTEKTIYPVKQVDTMLGVFVPGAHDQEMDAVPILSRGEGKGLYIESANKTEGEINRNVYRLDYITDVPNGPLVYTGKDQSITPEEAFGSDLSNPIAEVNGKPVSELPEGEIVLSDEDTGIFMAWGKQVLQPGETLEFSYAVGINAETMMKIDKKVENTTSNDEFNRVGDELDYTVTLTNSAEKDTGLVSKIELSDLLPKEVEKPSKVTLTKSTGEEVNYPIEDVYDATTHSMKLMVDDMDGQDVISLRYRVKVKDTAMGKTLVNTARATGEHPNQTLFEIEALTETPIINLSKVIIHYQDTDGNEIEKSKIIMGDIGETYNEKPKTIFGYQYSSVDGEPSGVFAKEDKIVTFIYDKKAVSQLKLEVVNAANNSVDKQDVGLEEELTYTTTLTTDTKDLTEEQKSSTYKSISLSTKIDINLVNVKDVKLVDESGKEVGEATYDSEKHQIDVSIDETDEVTLMNNVKLIFKAMVKSDTSIGTEIKEIVSGKINYSINNQLTVDVISNEVVSTVNRGELIFESAPQILGFGTDNKISNKDKLIDLVTKDAELSVRDLRGSGSEWSMSVKLIEDLTNGDYSLTNSLRYIKDGNEQVINKDSSALVFQKITDSNDLVSISDQWTKANKPVLKVKAGLARVGEYKGTVQWALQDVPVFDE